MYRRTYSRLAGAIAVSALAGCGSSTSQTPDSETPPSEDTPEPTATSTTTPSIQDQTPTPRDTATPTATPASWDHVGTYTGESDPITRIRLGRLDAETTVIANVTVHSGQHARFVVFSLNPGHIEYEAVVFRSEEITGYNEDMALHEASPLRKTIELGQTGDYAVKVVVPKDNVKVEVRYRVEDA